MTVWFTSDTHFCHKKVSGLRWFNSPAEHDEEVTRRWNSVVRHDDIVWLLGDVGVGHDSDILDRVRKLKGRKQLVTGNHDSCHPMHRRARLNQYEWFGVFESIQAFAKVSVCGEDFLLSHFPYAGDTDGRGEDRHVQYRLRDYGMPLLHGHTHSGAKVTSRERGIFHVGMDAWDLAPAKDVQIKELRGNNGA